MLARRYLDNFDGILFFSVLAVAAAGLGVIYSATSGAAVSGPFLRQSLWLLLGLIALCLVLMIDYHTLAEFAPFLYGLALILLILTLLVGRSVHASQAWLGIGRFQFQPSEIAKVATVLMLAAYLGRDRVKGLGFVNFAAISAIVLVPVLLIIRQPDLGTAATFAPLLAGTVFLAGIRLRTLIVLTLIVALALPIVWGQLKPYQKERVKTFVEPTRDPKGAGYQLIQSLIAVGSGGILGKGFLAGTQGQLQFLPEQHTDFVFAVLAEERGFVGSFAVLALYFLILYRCIAIARAARDRLGVFLVMGVVFLVGGQAMMNIGVVVGLLPTTGVPLPLMSYGGSSLVSTLIGFGLVLNVWKRRLVN